MTYYAIEHTYGAHTVDSDGHVIGVIHRFESRPARDAWVQAGPDYTTEAGAREALKASHPAVRRVLRDEHIRWHPNRMAHTGEALPGEHAGY